MGKATASGMGTGITLIWLAASLQGGWAQTAKPVKWACIGNSITQGDSPASAYPALLAAKLGPAFQVENDGVSGCTLLKKGDKPFWTQGKLAQVFAFKPDMVTIKLGTNDSKPQNWRFKAEFLADYRALIDTLSLISSKPRIWLVLPVPAFTNSFEISGAVIKDEMIPLIKQLAQEKGLKVIDAHTPLAGRSNLFEDGVHPNAAGTDSLASILFRGFTGQVTRIACIGNSITDYAYSGAASGAVEADAYPIKLNMLLGRDYFVENDGVTGLYMQKDAQAGWGYWGTRGKLPQVFRLQPNIITIKLGTNDSRARDWNTARYLRDYRAMVDTLRGMASKPVIWASLPIPAWQVNGAWPFNGISNDIIKDSTIPAIRKVAAEKSVPIIDPNTPFQTLKALVPDGVHPNGAGQDTLAHVFYRALTAVTTAVAPRDAAPARAAGPGRISIGASREKGVTVDGRTLNPSGPRAYGAEARKP